MLRRLLSALLGLTFALQACAPVTIAAGVAVSASSVEAGPARFRRVLRGRGAVVAPVQAPVDIGLVGKIAGPTRFVKGVFGQVVPTHATWKARGINTLVASEFRSGIQPGYYPPVTTTQDLNGDGFVDVVDHNLNGIAIGKAQYKASVAALGFKELRDPDTAADLTNPNILAWNLPDEPNLGGLKTRYDGTTFVGAFEPADLQQYIDGWRTEFGGLKPVAVNMLMSEMAINNNVARYLNMISIDWFGGDIYPDQQYDALAVAGSPAGSPMQLKSGWNLGANAWLSTINGMGISKAYRPYHDGTGTTVASVGKPMFAYISTGHTGIGSGDNDVVTATRARTNRLQAWSSIINGAAGIKVFPQAVGQLVVTGSISGTTLTVSSVPWTSYPNRIYLDGAALGLKQVGATYYDPSQIRLTAQASGTTGNVGTYTLSSAPGNAPAGTSITLRTAAIGEYSGDDSTTPNLTELATLFANIDVLEGLGGNLLMDTTNGGRRRYDFWRSWDYDSGNPNTDIATMPEPSTDGAAWQDSYNKTGNVGPNNTDPRFNRPTMPRGFEAAVFKANTGRTYYLVLNLTDAARTLNIVKPALTTAQGGRGDVAGWNVSGMVFSRFEVKLFADNDNVFADNDNTVAEDSSTPNLLGKAGVDD